MQSESGMRGEIRQCALCVTAGVLAFDRGVPTSVRRGRVGGGKHVAVNFPLTLFTVEDEQLVVCLPRYLMSCEDFLLSGRSSTPVSQVAHLHHFVDRENHAHQPTVFLSLFAITQSLFYRSS